MNKPPSRIHNLLRTNAIFCIVSGLIVAVTAAPLAMLTGISLPGVFRVTGIVVVLFGLLVFWITTRADIASKAVWIIFVADVLWVLGSIILLAAPGIVVLTRAGKWLIGILAVIVGMFAILEFISVRKM